MPLREEVVQRFTDTDGNATAAVTRNQYGALVLNTARAMFIDVDFPEKGAGANLSEWFGRLLGRKKPSIAEENESTIRRRAEGFVDEHPGFCLRMYRTHSGVRLLATHDLFAPASAEVQACFAALGADPLYVRLCAVQDSFRARLTPKPWRCGLWKPPIPWPRETPEAQAQFNEWRTHYDKEQARFATCRYVATLGDAPVRPEIDTILQVHDHLTRSRSPCPWHERACRLNSGEAA